MILKVLFPIFFRDLGFIADLALLAEIVISIFLLQALPLVTMSVGGIIGAAFGFGIMSMCTLLYLSKIKSEFYYLKRIPLSAKTGFKKSWLKILDICVIAFLSGISLALWHIPYITTFGINLAIGAFVALFGNVVILKDFITWHVNINTKDYRRLKFTKGEDNE